MMTELMLKKQYKTPVSLKLPNVQNSGEQDKVHS